MRNFDNIRAYETILIMNDSVDPLDDEYVFQYLINARDDYEYVLYDDKVIFKKKVEDYLCLKKSHKVIIDNDEFVNGYKVVETLNGEYAYFSEKENKLLPYRYHYATNFNEHGFAMVARDGMVSWINKDFEYFNAITRKFHKDNRTTLKGYLEVEEFSKGNVPLSRVVSFEEEVSYLKTDGELMKFSYDFGDHISNWSYDEFDDLFFKNFDDNGFMVSLDGKKILSDDGLILTKEQYIEKKKNKLKVKVKDKK